MRAPKGRATRGKGGAPDYQLVDGVGDDEQLDKPSARRLQGGIAWTLEMSRKR